MKELKNPSEIKSRIAYKKRKNRSGKTAGSYIANVPASFAGAVKKPISEPAGTQPETTAKQTGETFTDGAVRNALIKKATGYISEETVTEYSFGDVIETPVKKKVTKKEVPPDITAIKMLLGESAEEISPDYRDMTDEELIAEKNRLIRLLKTESD